MGRPRSPGVEDIRYTNPITGDISPTSRYLNEQGIKKNNKPEYRVNGEWVSAGNVPHQRKNQSKNSEHVRNRIALLANSLDNGRIKTKK